MNELVKRYEKVIAAFPSIKVAVIGDMVADVFVYGKPYQLSREAPVVIVKHESQKVVPGGAANTVNNLVKVGAQVYPVGLIGDDGHGDALVSYFQQEKVDTSGIIKIQGRNTIAKMRVMAGGSHTSKQQIVRIDYDPGAHMHDQTEEKIIAYIRKIASSVDGFIISDYNYDLFSPAVIKTILEVGRDKFVAVDSHYKLPMFKGVSVVTPNENEAIHTVRCEHDESPDMNRVGRKLYEMIKPTIGILVTRGNEGMMLFENEKSPLAFPIVGSDDVTDVTGAGDTVVSILALSLLAGADFETAARLANYAAGIVVMKSGTATTTREELIEFIKRCLDEKTSEPVFA